MGIQEIQVPQHWNYFLALDDDVMRLSRYIELTKDNFNAYSLEMARILFAAASEVDVVAKQICRKLNPKKKADKIIHYRAQITTEYPDISTAVVRIPKFGLTLNPWQQWGIEENNPVWWKAYNNVKHHRHTNFADANLHNTLNAVAGLFILLLYFYPEEALNAQLGPDPNLFRAGQPFITDFAAWGPNVTVYSRDQIDIAWQRIQGQARV